MLEREEIYSRLWGYTMVSGDRSVDVFVRKLRQKLEKASPNWRYIHTHFGIGYRFAAESLEVVDPERRALVSARRLGTPTATGRPAIRASSRGRRRTTSSPLAPSRRTTARPPFFRSARAPVSSATTFDRSGSCPTSSSAPVGRQAVDHVECLGAVEAARQRRVHLHPLPLLLAPALGGELRRLARAHAWG